jgi:heme o synthase
MVVFSSLVGYYVAPNAGFDIVNLFLLFLGGMLVTASANACNEIMEQHSDKLMKRTSTRPLPTGRMDVKEAMTFAAIALVSGILILWVRFNLLAAFISLFSFVLYVLAYTPLKRISNINVFVGAIPGALPALIGWAAATGTVSLGGWCLFGLQFMWQFPHFWAIAWLAHNDYKAAGLKMMPTNSKDNRFTSMQCVQYCVAILTLSILPVLTHIGGWIAVSIIGVAGAYFLYRAINFYRYNDDAHARQLMFASFIYLPLVYLALIIDKV